PRESCYTPRGWFWHTLRQSGIGPRRLTALAAEAKRRQSLHFTTAPDFAGLERRLPKGRAATRAGAKPPPRPREACSGGAGRRDRRRSTRCPGEADARVELADGQRPGVAGELA